jgi:hypothetical protein
MQITSARSPSRVATSLEPHRSPAAGSDLVDLDTDVGQAQASTE